jgi:glutathione S-transferase
LEDDVFVLRIHGYLISTWTRTACMTCLEKGAEYELVPLAYGGAEHFAIHPFGRMPVLEVDGLLIPEGLAVMGYLDESLPGAALQPADALARARMRTWMSICGDYVYRDVVRTIPRDREPTDQELTTARTVLERIEPMIGDGRFLVGETLTLADLYLAPQISNCREKAPQVLEGLSALGSWFAGIAGRESFQRTTYAA